MPKTNLKTLAYNTIRSKIVTCQYAPGTFLNEEQLTTELSLSRTPVGHQGKPCGVKEYHSAGSDPGCHGETDEGRA